MDNNSWMMRRALFLLVILITLGFISPFSVRNSAQEPEPLIPCAVPSDSLVGQGGLTVDLLGGLTVDPLGGLTVDPLSVSAGSLALTVDLLNVFTPAGFALTVDPLGGLTVDPLEVQRIIEQEAATFAYDYQWLNDRLNYLSSGFNFGTEPVVILVLDAFGDPTRAHGEDVFEVANDFVNLPEAIRNGTTVSLQSLTGANIFVDPVDITDSAGGFVINGPQGVKAKLEAAVNSWMARGVNRYVINMSFGLVPCDDSLTIPLDEGGTTSVSFSADDFYDYQQNNFVAPTCEDLEMYASSVVSYSPALTKGGNAINEDRINPETALGAPDQSDGQNGFVSLGFGGELILELSLPGSKNPHCPDLVIEETSFGNPSDSAFPESARIFISQSANGPWFELSPVAVLDEVYFDLPMSAPDTFNFVRILDASDVNSSRFNNGSDGYDVDGIIAHISAETNDLTILDYFENLGLSPTEAQAAADQILDPVAEFSDPELNELLALLQSYLDASAGPGDFAAVPVAASGNYRAFIASDPYNVFNEPVAPLQPALDPQTIAVCAGLGPSLPGQLAYFTHDGNVCVPGAWYTTAGGKKISGSSFAAPVFSAYMAGWLSYEDPDACNFVDPNGGGRVPLLADENRFINSFVGINTTPVDCELPVENVLPGIASYTMFDADTDLPVEGYENITGNINIPIEDLPDRVTFVANPTTPVGSIKMQLSGPRNVNRTENIVPHALFGDSRGGGDLRGRSLPAGTYTLTSTPYSERNRRGDEGAPLSIEINIGLPSDGSSQSVTGLSFVDAASDTILFPMTDNMVIDLAEVGNNHNFVATTNPTQVGSVQFILTGERHYNRTENILPYAAAGDSGGGTNYRSWSLPVGNYTIEAIPYTERQRRGDEGVSLTIHFSIIDTGNEDSEPQRIVIEGTPVPMAYDLASTEVMSAGIVRPTFTWYQGEEVEEGSGVFAERFNITVFDNTGAMVMDTWADAALRCTGDQCTFTPDNSILPYGLSNGEYTWFVTAWGNNTASQLSDEGVMTINAPAPALPNVRLADGDSTAITWDADTNAAMYQVYIGQADSGAVFQNWLTADTTLCDETTCTFTPTVEMTAGTYEVYIQAWGAGGFSDGGVQGWAGPATFTIQSIGIPTNLSVSANAVGQTVLSWDADPNATWHQVWFGRVDRTEIFSDWYEVTSPICDNGQCSITVTMNLPEGEYIWYVQAYGPGGYSTGGINGWAQGPTVIR